MSMIKLASEFIDACLRPSDINQHLPTLYDLAKECASVTELGVRSGLSSRAFLFANVKLRSYDLILDDNVLALFTLARELGQDVLYQIGDSRTLVLETTDLLFIDTLHTYQQLSCELELHCTAANKYIVLHDLETFGRRGEDGGKGLIQAVEEFLEKHRSWKIKTKYHNNNGLWVLQSHV